MKAQNNVRITIRVDSVLKENAEALFERMGMNMSTALNVFLRKAVDESAIPFPVSVKKTMFGNGLSADNITEAFTSAVQDEIAEKRQKGFPVAGYDSEKKQAFLAFANGTREYIKG